MRGLRHLQIPRLRQNLLAVWRFDHWSRALEDSLFGRKKTRRYG
jgi:hypothetical protein